MVTNMKKRSYGQYCGLARAMEILEGRWALLIIRDLLVAPKRYTDLRNGLPRIPTNVLADRLRELELAGVIRRRALPLPAGSVVYELTEYGRELDGIVLALGRWGARLLDEPAADEVITADSLIMALRSTFQVAAAGSLEAGFELRLGEVVVHALVVGGTLEVAEGALPGADLVITAGPELRALMAGEVSPREALASGSVQLEGDEGLFARFAELFRIA
jgi:DNA-binding HxlR family transcriptional regulator